MPKIFNGLGSCTLKDVKGNGAGPQNIAAGYTHRELNTFEGDQWFCTLAGSLFTLQPGLYGIYTMAPIAGWWVAPGSGPRSKARLINASTGAVVAISTGQIVSNASGTDGAHICGNCIIDTTLNLQTAQSFYIDQKSTNGTWPGGVAVNYGDIETYTTVRIIKYG